MSLSVGPLFKDYPFSPLPGEDDSIDGIAYEVLFILMENMSADIAQINFQLYTVELRRYWGKLAFTSDDRSLSDDLAQK